MEKTSLQHVSITKHKLNKRRWFVLAAYCILSLAVAPTSTCFTAISNILQYFYDVSPTGIHLLSGVFAIAVLIFNLPASYILHRYELAMTLQMAAILNLIGAIVRYFSCVEEYGYYFLLIGNTFSALSLASYMFLPSKIATNWFGEKEKGKAIGISVGFDLLAVGLGFIHTTVLVKSSTDKNLIASGLKEVYLHQLVAAVLACLVMFLIKSRPKTPPTKTAEDNDILRKLTRYESKNTETKEFVLEEQLQEESVDEALSFWQCIKTLLKQRDFLIISNISAVTASLEITYEILLNDTIIKYFPGTEKEIGIVGFTAVVLGFFSNIVAGVVLDKTKAYRITTFVIFSLSTVFLIIWTLLLEFYHSFKLISITFCCFMMITTSYYSVAVSQIAIVTHPIDPGNGTMISMTLQSIYIIVVSVTSSFLLVHVSILYVNIATLMLLFGTILLTRSIKYVDIE